MVTQKFTKQKTSSFFPRTPYFVTHFLPSFLLRVLTAKLLFICASVFKRAFVCLSLCLFVFSSVFFAGWMHFLRMCSDLNSCWFVCLSFIYVQLFVVFVSLFSFGSFGYFNLPHMCVCLFVCYVFFNYFMLFCWFWYSVHGT